MDSRGRYSADQPDNPPPVDGYHPVDAAAEAHRRASLKAVTPYEAWMARWTGASPDLLAKTHTMLIAHYGQLNVPSIEALSFFGDEILLIIQTWTGHIPPDGVERMIRRAAGRVWSSDVLPYSEREWDVMRFWSGRATPEAVLYTLQRLRKEYGDHPNLPSAFDLSLRPDALLTMIRDMLEDYYPPDALPDLLDKASELLYGTRNAYAWHPNATGSVAGSWHLIPATPTGPADDHYGPDPEFRTDAERNAARHEAPVEQFEHPPCIPPRTLEQIMETGHLTLEQAQAHLDSYPTEADWFAGYDTRYVIDIDMDPDSPEDPPLRGEEDTTLWRDRYNSSPDQGELDQERPDPGDPPQM